MNINQNILPMQIKKIHIAKHQLKLGDGEYREILANFRNENGWPCKSSKELTEGQANVLLDIFKTKLGWKEKKAGRILKYEEYNSRDPKFASPAQMRKIDSAWKSNPNVKAKTDEALNNFIFRILKVNHISFVLKKDVNRLLKAIESISPIEGGPVRRSPEDAGG